ncbi:AAA ATPase [Candidatus Magnetomorum sp. HK-1]|nr:AAA ATPase [Candidatus Magnetomorum sp. HK-1]
MTMTYATFFELKDRPFRLSPDTEYFFPSEVHKDIMRHLLYSINTEEGFVEITGEPGIGKTITLRSLVKQIGEEVLISMIVNPTISPKELLKAVALDFGVKAHDMENQSGEHILRLIQVRLMDLNEKGTVAVIIIDEAQNLSDQALEQVCLISNIEIDQKKAVKIILVGQLELGKNLQRPELLKIYQRITVRCRLSPLSIKDTYLYIQHRIRVAGGTEYRQPKFSNKVIKQIYYYSNGLPRLINIICERCLMAAFAEKKKHITSSHVKKALKSFQPKESVAKVYKRNKRIRNTALSIMIIIVGWFAFPYVNELWLNHQKILDFFKTETTETIEQKQLPEKQNMRDAWINHKKKIAPAILQKEEQKVEDELSSDSINDMEIKPSDTTSLLKQSSDTTASEVTPHTKSKESAFEPQKEQVKDPEQTFPHQLMTTSIGQRIIVFFPDINRMMLWKYTETEPELIKKANVYANLREGIYLLGRDKDSLPFLFNPFIPGNKVTKLLPEIFCKNVGEILPTKIIPILVYLSGRTFDNPVYDNAQACHLLVEKWVKAWQSTNIDAFVNYYHKDDIMYYRLGKPPQQMAWENLKKSKTVTFARSADVSLQISNLSCIIDPGNPKTAIALFHQQYSSSNYSDEGMKVLFLSQVYDSESSADNHLDRQPDWRITGRFWLSTR